MKAFPGRALRLQDIEIRVAPGNGGRTGAPYAVILDKPTSSEIPAEHEGDSTEAIPEDVAASDVTASETDVDGQIVHISISHDGDYATAVCIAPEEPTPGDVGGEAAARGL
jgi:holo-[acyl-carrier protein] synthase